MEHKSKTIPQLEQTTVSELVQAGVDEVLIKDFIDSISFAGFLIDKLAFDQLCIKFPATQSRPNVLTTEFLTAHWKEIAGRVLVARLSADRSLRDLLLGFISAVSTKNGLTAALTARAALENSASYDNLSRSLNGRKEKIEATVLPFIRDNPVVIESLYDRSLIDDLKRFQHGARLWPTGEAPSSVEEWKAWRKQSNYKLPYDEESNREHSIARQFLDELGTCQENVMEHLKKISLRTQNMAVLGLYDLLSEYCHPNADNRGLGILSSTVKDDHAVIELAGSASIMTPGVVRGIWLGMIAIVEAIDVHIHAHNTIQESMHDLFNEIDLRG